MIWLMRSGYTISDPPGFVINKSLVHGRIVYMAVKSGKPWRKNLGDIDPPGWDDSTIIHVERNIDPYDEPARKAALGRCKDACEACEVSADV